MSRAPITFCSVFIGKVPGARDPNSEDVRKLQTSDEPIYCNVFQCRAPGYVQAVETYINKTKVRKIHPLVLPKLGPLAITPVKFAEL